MQIRTRLLSSLLACASSLVMVRAQSQPAPPKPSPEVRKLAVMVGRFKNEGEVKAGAFGPNSPALKVGGTDECKWIADGFGVLCIETVDIGGTKEIETDVAYYDPISKKYEYQGIRSTGETDNQTGPVSGDTWIGVGEGSLGEKVFHTRHIMKILSHDAYEYTEEWGEGDKPLELGLTGRCTRIAASKAVASKRAH
jgi:hypothetical protein